MKIRQKLSNTKLKSLNLKVIHLKWRRKLKQQKILLKNKNQLKKLMKILVKNKSMKIRLMNNLRFKFLTLSRNQVLLDSLVKDMSKSRNHTTRNCKKSKSKKLLNLRSSPIPKIKNMSLTKEQKTKRKWQWSQNQNHPLKSLTRLMPPLNYQRHRK